MKTLQEMPRGVVLGGIGGESYRMLSTIYTDDDMYWSPSAMQYVFSVEQYKDALFMYLYINKDSRKDPVTYLSHVLQESQASVYGDMYEGLEGFSSGIPFDAYLTEPPHNDPRILAARQKFLPAVGEEYRAQTRDPRAVRAALVASGVKYILVDERTYPEWDLSPLQPLTLNATSTDIILYSLSTTR